MTNDDAADLQAAQQQIDELEAENNDLRKRLGAAEKLRAETRDERNQDIEALNEAEQRASDLVIRAEQAERERDEARRSLCRKVAELGSGFVAAESWSKPVRVRSARDVAEVWGWLYLYDEMVEDRSEPPEGWDLVKSGDIDDAAAPYFCERSTMDMSFEVGERTGMFATEDAAIAAAWAEIDAERADSDGTDGGGTDSPPSVEHPTPPRIDATVRVDLDRGMLWVLGWPEHVEPPGLVYEDDGDPRLHHCDAMGCSSIGPHVLAFSRLWPEPEPLDAGRRASGEGRDASDDGSKVPRE